MAKRGKWTWTVAAILVVAIAAGAALLLRDSDDEPGWTSAPGRALAVSSCADFPELELGFERLPPLREPDLDVPSRNRWPGVSLEGVDGRLVRPGQYYGVELADATRRQATRDWQLKAWMLALGDQGNVVEEVSHDRMEGGRGFSPGMRMRVGQDPGFYRLDIRIADAGRWSGRYGFYLKAEPAHGEGRLVLAGRSFRPGQRVGMRVDNLGTEPLHYGTPVMLQRHDDGDWEPVPAEYVFTTIGLGAEGGEAGSCLSFELPPKLQPGRYRFVKEVSTRKEPRGYNDHLLTAEFKVINPL